MATKSRSKKTASRKTASKKTTPRKPAARKKARPATKDPMAALSGWITHTEFGSSDPGAMKTWCAKVLGWKFRPSFPMPDGGEYMLYTYSEKGGGGIRPTHRGEDPCTVPYVQVGNVKATFAKAIREGASEILAPGNVMPDLVIAVVRAPGGVMIGFAGPK
jgi:uncharacterized protein